MSSPAAIVRIVITGSRILGRAFLEAGRQAVKNAKAKPAIDSDVAGVGRATSGSPTDQLTVDHKLTLDEAHLILNTKKADSLETVLKNYELLFKQNSPPAPKPASEGATTSTRAGRKTETAHSHYLQSKVVRAKERIEAELKIEQQEQDAASQPSSPPPPGTSSTLPNEGQPPNPPLP